MKKIVIEKISKWSKKDKKIKKSHICSCSTKKGK